MVAHTVGGFAGGQAVVDSDDDTFQRMMDINLKPLLHILRAAIPPLRESGAGCVIAVSSRAAVEPGPNVGAYSASKAAMLSVMKTIAIENRDAGLRANVVLPGTIDTPANRQSNPDADFSKWVRPDAIASLIMWLAGDAGREINGAAIPPLRESGAGCVIAAGSRAAIEPGPSVGAYSASQTAMLSS